MSIIPTINSETWESYALDREKRNIARSNHAESFKHYSSLHIPVDEESLDWMSRDASTLITNILRHNHKSLESLARKASMIVNHYIEGHGSKRKYNSMNDSHSEIKPPFLRSGSCATDDKSLFAVPNVTVKLNEMMNPPLATAWLPGQKLTASKTTQKVKGQISMNDVENIEGVIKDGDIKEISFEFQSYMYESMTMTISSNKSQSKFPQLQISRRKLMELSTHEWCSLIPSSYLFHILRSNMEHFSDPMWEILTRTSGIVSLLATLSPSKNCGCHIISVLIPTSLQTISTFQSPLLSEKEHDVSQVSSEISTALIYRFGLGASSKSELLHLLKDLHDSNVIFGITLWLEITKSYFDYHN